MRACCGARAALSRVEARLAEAREKVVETEEALQAARRQGAEEKRSLEDRLRTAERELEDSRRCDL